MFNPIDQVAKARDAKRGHDLLQIKEALDVYYNDHNCYPLYIPFGQEWNEGQTLYMKKVPQDPDYPKQEYTYQIDESDQSCPQWNVVYARHTKQRGTNTLCPLTSLQNCTPTDYLNTYACSFSGSVNCDYIASNPIPKPPAPTSTPTPTSTPVPTSTPTPILSPTPTPESCPSKNYKCSGDPSRCNVVPLGTGDWCTPQCGGVCPGG